MSWAEVCARRLDRHALIAPARARPADVVAAIGGAHAQVPAAAEWSIGLRLAGATRRDVQEAVWSEHSLVKTFGPRGTVHLLAAQDLPMWTGALSAIPRPDPGLPEDARLTPDQTDAVVAGIAVALQDRELSADELTEALVDIAGPWAAEEVVPAWYGKWPRWRPAMYTAANRGVLCFGPSRGRTVTYTNPHRWLPEFRPTDGPAAVAELARRYLQAYGPATPAQFAQWLAVPRRWASDLFGAMSRDLQSVGVDGTVAWVVAGDTAAPRRRPSGVRLLPYFDAYTVGCQPRERVFPGQAAQRALAGGQAGNYPVLLIKGVVAGVWHQRRSGRKLGITVEPLQRLSAPQRRELDDQVARIGEFFGGEAQLTIGTVTVGPHA
jgi:hypothetical protein